MERILLAVSGGIDSMYLANTAPSIWPGASFAVAHCNFHLRGQESDGDELFVREWCKAREWPCFVAGFDTRRYAAEKGVSIEMAARELRYSWFAEVMKKEGFDALAVAHNACDNAETLFLNLLRGTGSKGVRGMNSTDRLRRPLLGTTRAEIRSRMESEGWAWREDSTNAESDCKRNILRNRVFPILSEINPSFIQTLGSDMAHLREVDDIAEDYWTDACGRIVREADGRIEVDVDGLLALKHWKYVLWRLMENRSLSDKTFAKMTQLLERYATRPRGTVTLSGKRFESGEWTVRTVGKKLTIEKRVSE